MLLLVEILIIKLCEIAENLLSRDLIEQVAASEAEVDAPPPPVVPCALCNSVDPSTADITVMLSSDHRRPQNKRPSTGFHRGFF